MGNFLRKHGMDKTDYKMGVGTEICYYLHLHISICCDQFVKAFLRK
jgi:hypothetical protein